MFGGYHTTFGSLVTVVRNLRATTSVASNVQPPMLCLLSLASTVLEPTHHVPAALDRSGEGAVPLGAEPRDPTANDPLEVTGLTGFPVWENDVDAKTIDNDKEIFPPHFEKLSFLKCIHLW